MGSQYSESTYGDRIADVYDQWFPDPPPDATSTLRELAGAGPVLELGVGTGRHALPLANMGLEVHGIESSAAMLAKLADKLGGERIAVTLGNFAEVGVSGKYSLIFVVFNTLFSLSSQEEQLQCFMNVAKHLHQDGLFVVEGFTPNLNPLGKDRSVKVSRMGVNEVLLIASRHDRFKQRIASQQILINESGINMYPAQIRYAWPAELDLMARLAGMRLKDRWSDWQKSPYTARSANHIVIYQLA